MRSAYGAEEMGIGGQLVTIVVDVANVMGSRPDGWWRDRAGAAVRLHAEIARLAASGRAILRDEPGEAGEPGENEAEQASVPGFVMVLEGAAKAAAARLAPAEPDAQAEPDAKPPGAPGAPGQPRRARSCGRCVRGRWAWCGRRVRGTTRSSPWCASCLGGAWS